MGNNRIVAIQANPISSLNTNSDTSLFIASELTKKNFRTFFYTPDDLYIAANNIFAKGRFAKVEYNNYESSFLLEEEITLNLKNIACLLIRQDPPFNMEYVTTCYILEELAQYIPVINNPSAIRTNSEKMCCLKFPCLIPPTMVVKNINEEVIEFLKCYQEVVIKPLYWFGGKHLEKISYSNLDEAIRRIEFVSSEFGHIIIQKFLPAIYQGDKRIIIINGRAEGVLKRIPQNGNFIANLAAGGKGAQTEITFKDQNILEQICPFLIKQGIILAGVDVIDGYLSEINITSPTGLVAIDRLYGLNLAANIAEYIERVAAEAKLMSA